jgi:hypothetical protein
MATSFSGGRNRSTRRESSTMRRQLVEFIGKSNQSEKYMNEYFEYMTGYAVLIVKAYIKMVEFLNSSVTILSNCT